MEEYQTNTQPQKPVKNVFYVGLLSFFGGISQDIFAPILPIYLTSILGFDKTIVGIAEGVVTASASFSKIISGLFSDRFKRQRPIIFLGYFLSMVSRPLLALTTSLGGVVGLRLLDGIGKGTKDPAKDVLIAGSSVKSNRGKSFGIARMLDTLGSVVGPLILFGLLWLFEGGSSLYHNILLFSAIPLLITLSIIIFCIKEAPKTTISAETSSPQSQQLPLSFYVFLGIIMLFTLGNSSDAFLILRSKEVGVSLLHIPLVIALFNIVYAVSAVPFGALSDKIGRVNTLMLGWGAYALTYVGFALVNHPSLIWVLYGFYGIYYATSEGVSKALLSDIIPREIRGRAFGIYGTVVGLTTLPASFLAGFLWDTFGVSAPFYFGASMACIALVGLFIFSKIKNI